MGSIAKVTFSIHMYQAFIFMFGINFLEQSFEYLQSISCFFSMSVLISRSNGFNVGKLKHLNGKREIFVLETRAW